MKPRTAKHGDWDTKPLPEKRADIPLDYEYTPEERKRIVRGFIPEQMEDKWFVVYEDHKLFFYRSWTGFCIYIAHFKDDGTVFRATRVEANRLASQYGEKDDERDRKLVSYLIDVLLLHKPAEFPGRFLSQEKNALEAWGLAGRAILQPSEDGSDK